MVPSRGTVRVMDDELHIAWTVRGRIDAMVDRMSLADAQAVRALRLERGSDYGLWPRFHYHRLASRVLDERPHLCEPFTSSPTGQGRVLCRAAERVLGASIDPQVWRVSVRRPHPADDPLWPRYLAELGLTGRAADLRTIDGWVCPKGEGVRGDRILSTLDEVSRYLSKIRVAHADEYVRVYVDADLLPLSFAHPDFRLLGYDLSDETRTSSLFNCGSWAEQGLGDLAARRNDHGLLAIDDAREAQERLPIAFFDDHHGWCTVWALFEATADLAQPTP